MSRVLVVDDERSIRITLGAFLGARGHTVEEAEHFDQAMEIMERLDNDLDLVISDIILGGKNGVELLGAIKERDPDIPVVLITGEPSLDTATSGLRYGAFDYLAKPVLKGPLLRVTERALEFQRLKKLSRDLELETTKYKEHLEELVQEQTEDIRAAHEALKLSEARFRTLIATVPESIFELDEIARVLWCNDQARKEFGNLSHDFGLSASLVDPGSSFRWKNALQLAFQHRAQTNSVECLHQLESGRERLFAWRFRAASGGNRGACVLCSARDVTEKRKLEERSKQQSKMEAVGQLAGGVAHDFNNILSAILSETSSLQLHADKNQEITAGLAFVERAVVRAQDLTKKLLSFAHRAKAEFKSINISECLVEAAELITRTLGSQIAFELALPSKPIFILGDATELNQVFLNLGVNARDAVDSANQAASHSVTGTIRIEAYEVSLLEKLETQHSEIPPGDYAVIKVADNGCGIPIEIQKRVFEPFFTTKARGQGTGMGLSLVYGIVSAHSGYLDLKSSVGEGTEFTIYLPIFHGSTALSRASVEPVKSTEGGVLVIDDESLVLDSTVRVLQRLGFAVRGFQGWQEALAYFEEYGDSISVVVLDYLMPGADCGAILRTLREKKPEVGIILTSGYGLNQAIDKELKNGPSGFIQKPYRIDQLSKVIQQLAPNLMRTSS